MAVIWWKREARQYVLMKIVANILSEIISFVRVVMQTGSGGNSDERAVIR